MSRVLGASATAASWLMIAAGAAQAQGGAQGAAGDRYGPPAPGYADPTPATWVNPRVAGAQQAPWAASVGPQRMLVWPGKVVTGPAQPAFTQAAAASGAEGWRGQASWSRPAIASATPARVYTGYSPVSAGAQQGSPAGPHYGLVRAVPRWTPPNRAAPTPPVLAGAPAAGALPRSIYETPPVVAQLTTPPPMALTSAGPAAAHAGWAPPRRPWYGAQGDNVRLYSLHRPYGLRPDPAPIPPQFFTASADLSEPTGPNAVRRVVSGAGTAAQAARAVQASDSDTTAPAQP